MLKRLLRGELAQGVLAWLLGAYLALALHSTRWTFLGDAHAAPVMRGEPMVVVFWHDCLPLVPPLWLRARRAAARLGVHSRLRVLVSRHRDGRLVGAVMRRFTLEAVYGSSSRGGAAGLRACVAALAAGEHVALTPDGPRGPRRVAAPGVAQLAALTGVAVLPVAACSTRRLLLRRSWDRMMLPLPFGQGVIVCGAPVVVPRNGWAGALPAIEAGINDAAAVAEAWCRAR